MNISVLLPAINGDDSKTFILDAKSPVAFDNLAAALITSLFEVLNAKQALHPNSTFHPSIQRSLLALGARAHHKEAVTS